MHSGLKLYAGDTFISYKKSLSHERGNERSERANGRVRAAEGMSEASSPEQVNEGAVRAVRANGRASGPVLQSVILVILVSLY